MEAMFAGDVELDINRGQRRSDTGMHMLLDEGITVAPAENEEKITISAGACCLMQR
jgi:hypothetical protein